MDKETIYYLMVFCCFLFFVLHTCLQSCWTFCNFKNGKHYKSTNVKKIFWIVISLKCLQNTLDIAL